MVEVQRATLGDFVALRVTTRRETLNTQDGDLIAVNGVTIGDVESPSGASVTPLPSVVAHLQEGEYIAHWDTSALTETGDYKVEVVIRHGFDTVTGTSRTARKHIVVRLVNQGAA